MLLTADGPKVIDFGIAQTLDATSVTRTGMSVGSPGFMAPEQVSGHSGPAADIFASGLTVAFAASGRPPFGIGPADVIFYRILHDDPDTEAVPESLKPLVAGALARKPEDRPAARDLLTALAAGADEAPGNRPGAGRRGRRGARATPGHRRGRPAMHASISKPAVTSGPTRRNLTVHLRGMAFLNACAYAAR